MHFNEMQQDYEQKQNPPKELPIQVIIELAQPASIQRMPPPDEKKQTPLERQQMSLAMIDFARSGDVAGVQQCLEQGINPNYILEEKEQVASFGYRNGYMHTDTHKTTALLLACWSANVSLTRVLLEAKADPNLLSPLSAHVSRSRNMEFDIFKSLLEAKADPNPSYYSVIHQVIAKNQYAAIDPKFVTLLLQHGANPNYRLNHESLSSYGMNLEENRDNVSLLHLAIYYDQAQIIQPLLTAGADKNHEMKLRNKMCCRTNECSSMTCFVFLCMLTCYGSLLCCDTIPDKVGDMCVELCAKPMTPLQYARFLGKPKAVEILTAAEAVAPPLRMEMG